MVKPNSFLARSARLTNSSSGALTAVAAVFAHEVAMGTGGQVVRGRTMPEMGMDDDAEPLQLLEVAIDGRQVHVGGPRLDDGGEVLGAVVARVVEDGLEEQAPRVRDPPAALADQGEDVVDGADVVPGCVCAEGNAHDPSTVRPEALIANHSQLPYRSDSEMAGSGALSEVPPTWRARSVESARFATA